MRPMIEKGHHGSGALEWARGTARELYRDGEVNDSCPVRWRIAGQNSRWFTSLLPRHKAGSWLGESSIREVSKNYPAKPPPFKKWRFVLVALIESDGVEACLVKEVSGETLVEVSFLTRRPAWIKS